MNIYYRVYLIILNGFIGGYGDKIDGDVSTLLASRMAALSIQGRWRQEFIIKKFETIE